MTKKEHVDLLTRLVVNKHITLLEAFDLYECTDYYDEEEKEEEEESEDEFVQNFLNYILNNPTSTTTNLNDYLNKKK